MPFAPSEFFVLRTPVLPFETLLEWADADDPEAYLLAVVARADVGEALALASQGIGELLNGSDPARSRKLLLALSRYVCRMSARPTPFGLMAGYSTGVMANETHLKLPETGRNERITQIGVQHLNSFCATLAGDPAIRARAVLRPNSSMYEVAGQYRYVESHETFDGRGYQLQAVRAGRELRTAIELARRGMTAAELAEGLANDLGAGVEAARGYVEQLVDNQILLPDLYPRVTVRDTLEELGDRLALVAEAAAGRLRRLRDELQRIDACGTGLAIGEYQTLRQSAAELFPDVPFDTLLHVALRKPAAIELSRGVADRLLRAVEVLRRLFGTAELDPVRRFRERFAERYEGRFVPMLEVLDEELGIGFIGYGEEASDDAPLLQGLEFPGIPSPPRSLPCDKLLIEKVGRALRDQANEIVISAGDVERMALPSPLPLPDSFAVLASLGAHELVLHTVLGPSGARLFGRFCQGDPRLEELVRAHLRDEERLRPGVVFAEAVNLPQGRSANIIARPPLRDYDVTFLGGSGLPPEQQIAASDLLLGVRENRLVLWSRTLDREIVPRVTSVHNAKSHGVSVYRFLVTLARQGVASAMFWDWGSLADLPFLPRVRYENVVLSRATWFLRREERQLLREGTAAERLRMPRFLLYMDGDQELLIDLKNPMTIDAFLGAAANKEFAIVHELLPQPDGLVVEGPEGHYTHEMVIPFNRLDPVPARAAARPAIEQAEDRVFPPGGEWLYYKLYTGYSTADRLLADSIAPLMQQLREEGLVRSWFFIRYSDPDFHLRVRLAGDPEVLWGEVRRRLSASFAPLLEKGWMSRVQIDTYVRELERYGGPRGIKLAEEIFCADSDAVVSLLPLAQTDAALRWQLAVYGSDALLTDLGFDLDGKSRLLERLVQLFGGELRVNRTVRDQLAAQTRARREAMRSLFGSADDEPWRAPYRRRSVRVRPLAAALRELDGDFDGLAGSYLHMHLNRWFRSTARAQEFVVYDLLHRWVLSQIARERVTTPTSSSSTTSPRR